MKIQEQSSNPGGGRSYIAGQGKDEKSNIPKAVIHKSHTQTRIKIHKTAGAQEQHTHTQAQEGEGGVAQVQNNN